MQQLALGAEPASSDLAAQEPEDRRAGRVDDQPWVRIGLPVAQLGDPKVVGQVVDDGVRCLGGIGGG